MLTGERRPMVLVAGWIPAQLTYGPLLSALGDEVEPVLHAMAMMSEGAGPGYGLDTEARGIEAAADGAGLATFDLVGYSAGATAALAFTADRPERVRTLTAIEPASIGGDDWSEVEVAFMARFEEIMALPPHELMPAFQAALLARGTPPPPPPADLPLELVAAAAESMKAAWPAFRRAPLDRDALRAFAGPVYLPVGGRSNPRMLEAAKLLASILPHARVEVYEERHHFDLLEAEPGRLAAGIRALWRR